MAKRLVIILLAGALGCDIPPGRQVYNPNFILERFDKEPLGWTIEDRYQTGLIKIPDSVSGDYKPRLLAIDGIAPVLSQRVLLEDSGAFLVVATFDLELHKGSFFVEGVTPQGTKRVDFRKSQNVCNRTLFEVFVDESTSIDLRIGFDESADGEAFPKGLFLYKERYDEVLTFDSRPLKDGVSQFAGISEFNYDNFDDNISKLAGVVNSALLDTVKTINQFLRNPEFEHPETEYLYKYIFDDNIEQSYAQKSSLVFDDLLKLFFFRVRQVHWLQNCSGIHQFVEYYNPYTRKWIAIDLSYGVRYRDPDGSLMGFEQVVHLAKRSALDSTYIEKGDFGQLYFDAMEIVSGWENSDPAVSIINKQRPRG